MHESRCGLLCSECENREACGCEGCLDLEEGNWAGDCEIKKCCEEKQLEHCGKCPDFPCDLLRNTSFDEEEGDNGERLVTLKRWAEEESSRKQTSGSLILGGLAVGASAGAVFGALSESFAAVMFACILVGTAVGVMIDITKKK
ncbi:MAG: DUF3795 domain-containing protein [Oscillospiraceae bacterium]|nr:DUF3795 domain-containing protein [Oscillospiraceae bacterium]